jgi:hypothetical protein
MLFELTPIRLGNWRFPVQIIVTLMCIYTIYFLSANMASMIDAVPGWSNTKLTSKNLPTWAFIVIPLLCVIPGLYVFTFLKYNSK